MAGEFLQNLGQGLVNSSLLFQQNLDEQQRRRRQQEMDALAKFKLLQEAQAAQQQQQAVASQARQNSLREQEAQGLLGQFTRGLAGQRAMETLGADSSVALSPRPQPTGQMPSKLGQLDFSQMQTQRASTATIPESIARPAAQMTELQARLAGLRDLSSVDRTLSRAEFEQDARLARQQKIEDRDISLEESAKDRDLRERQVRTGESRLQLERDKIANEQEVKEAQVKIPGFTPMSGVEITKDSVKK